MSDETPKRMYSTVPPPDGAEDLYSASTVVGQASAELLALVRAATEEGESKKSSTTVPAPSASQSDDAKLTAMKEAASRSAKEAAANEVAREAAKAASSRPPAAAASNAPSAVRTTPPVATKSRAPAFAALVVPSVPPATPAPKTTRPEPERADVAKAAAPVSPPEPKPRVIEETAKRPATRTADPPRPQARGAMPPALAIALVFAAVAFALAAIVR
jgi:hypothetical protein